MKNFICVINKEKIYAYIVSICTIVTLFFMSSFINNNFDNTLETTSSNVVENTTKNEIKNNNVSNNENQENIITE